MTEDSQSSFDQTQANFFDEMANSFKVEPPPKILSNLARIVQLSQLDQHSKVLDVGTGQGILIPYFIEGSVRSENIVACDLSPEMIKGTQQNNKDVHFFLGNVNELTQSKLIEITGRNEFLFDKVFFNACFGNFEDQAHVLSNIRNIMADNGEAIISHPLGRQFVEFLHNREAHIVPNLLPDESEMNSIADAVGFRCEELCDEKDFYFARLVKVENYTGGSMKNGQNYE